MKKLFTSTLVLIAINTPQVVNTPLCAQAEPNPTISITHSRAEKDDSEKLIKVKTTIVTKKSEKSDTEASSASKKEKRDIELSSDVDKILQEMEIDDADPLTETPQTPVEKAYKPVKKNFLWIAFGVIAFPIILFALLLKAMQAAKTRFEKEEKEKGLSKEEKLLDELEKEQKKTKKKHRSLSDILGGSRQRQPQNTAFENEFDREDEDFEFMVEEVVLVEETAHAPSPEPIKEEIAPEPQPEPVVQAPEAPPKEEPQITPEEQEEQAYDEPVQEPVSDIIDTFGIDDRIQFVLVKKDEACNLVCKLGEREILIMHLDKAQKFNKVRKIDSKPGRDVYMVKLDSWRGLVEVKEDSAKYLMDI